MLSLLNFYFVSLRVLSKVFTDTQILFPRVRDIFACFKQLKGLTDTMLQIEKQIIMFSVFNYIFEYSYIHDFVILLG